MSVIDFNKFKDKKQLEEDVARGRVPVSKTHIKKQLNEVSDEFAARMSRIRMSLEKINYLMAELKRRREQEGGLED